MPERHLAEFEQLYEKQPFGLWREDFRMAQLAVVVARAAGNKMFGVDHLMGFWRGAELDAQPGVETLVLDADVVD